MILLLFLLMCYTQLIELCSGSIRYTRCKTENECVVLRDCKRYMIFINSMEKPLKPSVVEFLRGQQCGFEEGFPKVCCTDIPKDFAGTSQKEYGKGCNKSKCVSLKKCRPYMDLINGMEKPLQPVVVKFLRLQQCGFQGNYPMVCCSLLPKNLQMLKHAQSNPEPHAPKELNILSNEHGLKDIFSQTEATTMPSEDIKNKKNKEKAEIINREFDLYDFFDFTGPFDLIRRKRFSNGSEFDIEIR